ncbi:MAG: hypothetical protein Q4D60_06460 [Eubacteriales bacterium]|nr:hypothetical protein [Eubacteriales bacterium]
MFKKNKKALRKSAMAACVVFLFVTFFSFLFLAKEVNHDCIGEDCPVCACIHQIKQNLEERGTGAFVQCASVPFMVSLLSLGVFAPFLPVDVSLVGKKVRLDD